MKSLFLFLLIPATLFCQIQVTFRVTMSVQIKKGNFVPGRDSIVVRGSFQIDAGDKDNWQGNAFRLSPIDKADSVYAVTVTLPVSKIDSVYQYKYVQDGSQWEYCENRVFTLSSSNMALTLVFFNNEDIYIPVNYVTVKLIISADLRKTCAIRESWLNDVHDSLYVIGFDADAGITILPGSQRKMVHGDSVNRGIYTTTIYLKGVANSTAHWAFKLYPDTAFSSLGYEMNGARSFTLPPSDSTIIFPLITPDFSYTIPSIGSICFTIDLNKSPVNAYTRQPIPVNKIKLIALYGSTLHLGGFLDKWAAADSGTIIRYRLLNDSGLNGDKVPGDNIWTTTIQNLSDFGCDTVHYRYGCFYSGADTVNGGVFPFDNEFAGKASHHFSLQHLSGTPITVSDVWGSIETGIRSMRNNSEIAHDFVIEGNYPNPFNPSTVISFSLLQQNYIRLSVWNILGREIATLIDKELPAGDYHIPFSGASLPSGIYFYKLTANKQTEIRKMLLVK